MSVRSVRAFVRSRGRARSTVLDRYVTVFSLVMLAAVLGNPVAGMLGGLAGAVDPTRMGAGMALIALSLGGFLVAARGAGPVWLPAADASWLLLSPLNRQRLLGRTGRLLGTVAVVAGLVLGLAFLAVLGAPDQLVWRVLGALVLGVSVVVGGMAVAVLAQASQSWQFWLTFVMVALLGLAVVAVSGQARTVLAIAAGAPLPAVTAAVSGAAVAAAVLLRQAWTSLDRIPARTLVAASTRAGHLASAATSLDPGALTWIAEDNHWRARTLTSRRWPSLPAPLALAWQDWRRLARRPGRMATMLATAGLPAVFAQAGATSVALGAAVLLGGLAVATASTSGARRDRDNPALARLMGVGHRPALTARAILPAVVSGVWAAVALTGVTLVTGGPGVWWLFGVAAAPALAAGALRMARRGPIDHSMPVIDTPGGAIPTGVATWAATGVDLAVLGCLPTAMALQSGAGNPASYLVAQAVAGVAVLAAFVWRSRPARTESTPPAEQPRTA
ncbi:DUF6297 family protein [Nonomuraea cypriaca]|uniref:DUF6297 family protein n=1 Tax=Nonomuraea cypriaca TaxID=1187855 RepID=UPI001A9C2847|nr:DUF6297 family protein [Nonomuraea cypriaca]